MTRPIDQLKPVGRRAALRFIVVIEITEQLDRPWRSTMTPCPRFPAQRASPSGPHRGELGARFGASRVRQVTQHPTTIADCGDEIASELVVREERRSGYAFSHLQNSRSGTYRSDRFEVGFGLATRHRLAVGRATR